MTTDTRVEVRPLVLALAGTALLAIGMGAGYVVFAATHASTPNPSSVPAPVAPAVPVAASARTPIVVPMTTEAQRRAGIVLTPVASGAVGGVLRVPGVVEANGYRRVAVTPLASGRVTRVGPQLGDRVVRGQTIAEIFSPELAEAQASYVSARAELDAHDRELARMEKLVELGSASRQELERVVAEHTARRTAVQSGAARLTLFGVSEEAIERLGAGHSATSATLAVLAPLSGVVTERPANVGVNVDSATPLATIVDLSTVWVMADIYEKDVARVRVGTSATVTAGALPQLFLTGKITYIDPQVNAETRTERARVEVANPRQELRLGMLAEVRLEGAASGSQTMAIPRRAVQHLFDRSVVYVVDPASDGAFLERTVRLGDVAGDTVVVLAGLERGDVVVSDGSFHVRAERERLGLGEPAPTPEPPQAGAHGGATAVQTAKVTVTKDGFSPSTITVKAGSPARLVFVRTTDLTCATEVAVPSLKIRRPLPLNEPVAIEFTPAKAGAIDFACGMDMFKGAIVAE
jgi:cobalt-zinc-cadmium efflux system membrane fusion protein